jgi:hypothetical protein
MWRRFSDYRHHLIYQHERRALKNVASVTTKECARDRRSDEGSNVRGGLLDGVFEAREGPRAGASLVDDGSCPQTHAGVVGVNAKICHPFVNMCVNVDQTRAHDLTGRINARVCVQLPKSPSLGRFDRYDAAIIDGDIGQLVESSRWIHNMPADYDAVGFQGGKRRAAPTRHRDVRVFHHGRASGVGHRGRTISHDNFLC